MDYRLDEEKENALQNWAIHSFNQVSIGMSHVSIASFKGSDFIQVIWDKPDAARPNLPYATLNISSGPRNVGPAEERYKELDTWTYHFRKVMTLSVNVFANSDHLGILQRLLDAIELPSYQQIYQEAGLACWGTSNSQDISILLDTKYEKRAQADFTFSFPSPVDDKPMEIHKVTVNGLLNGEHEVSQDIDINT